MHVQAGAADNVRGMSTTVRQIRLAEFWSAPNIDALLDEYARESAIEGLPHPAPHRELYAVLEERGALHMLAVYQDDLLVGFLVLLVSLNPHYGQVLAVTESFFVASTYRKAGGGLQLLAMAEALAKEHGAIGMFVSAPLDSRLAKVMPGVGYRETTRAFFRGFA